jgi:SAM-dependent methyltransferase
VGLAIGVTPLYGLHLALVLAVCLPLRLDARLAYVAANVSVPPVAPLLGFVEVQLGSLVRNGEFLPLRRETLEQVGPQAFLFDLVVGTPILAAALAALGYGATLAVAMLWPQKTPLGLAIGRVAARYPTRSAKIHARAKLASDPVARALASLGALGDVSDVGCGAGHMSLLLLETGQAARVRGFDPDDARIALARAAANGLAADYERGDARTHAIAPCDTVLLVDVLHYVAPDAQDAIVARAAAAARRRVVVRDIDPRRGMWTVLTKAAERLRKKPSVLPAGELVRLLERHGLRVTVTRCDDGTPFANALLVAERS